VAGVACGREKNGLEGSEGRGVGGGILGRGCGLRLRIDKEKRGVGNITHSSMVGGRLLELIGGGGGAKERTEVANLLSH